MDDWKEKIPPTLKRVFDFQTAGMKPPNRVIFGFGASDQIGAEAAKLSGGRAMLVSDQTLQKTQTVDRLGSILSQSGLQVQTFTEVEPEPHVESAEALYQRCLAGEVSMLIGVGGGSVMDTTKLVAQSVGAKQSPRDYMEGKVVAERSGIPMILVPTTAGTGSEVSPYLVVKIGGKKRAIGNGCYYPDMAIVDPLLCVSMPPFVTATTGIDALSHAVEGMMHKNANPFSDALCLAGIEMIGRFLRRVVADGSDLEGRYYMSLAATMCMLGMAMSGGLYAHSACFIIGEYKPTAHGLGCALGLPYLMDYNLPLVSGKLARVAAALGEPTWMHSEWNSAKLAVQAVARLIRDAGLPLTLKEYGVQEKDLPDMARSMITLYPRPMNARSMGVEDAILYFRNMWEGNI